MELFNRVEELSKNLEALIAKAELWQLLFDESPDAVAVFDSSMRFFLVNDEFCNMTGFTREEIANQKLSLVIPPEFKRIHKRYEKQFSSHPKKRTNRHGWKPSILTRSGEEVNVSIDLSYFYYDERPFYTAFIRRIDQ